MRTLMKRGDPSTTSSGSRDDAPRAVVDDARRIADALGYEHFLMTCTADTIDQAITSRRELRHATGVAATLFTVSNR
jgi:hypothetical protein